LRFGKLGSAGALGMLSAQQKLRQDAACGTAGVRRNGRAARRCTGAGRGRRVVDIALAQDGGTGHLGAPLGLLAAVSDMLGKLGALGCGGLEFAGNFGRSLGLLAARS
jgi:hypothetical protein